MSLRRDVGFEGDGAHGTGGGHQADVGYQVTSRIQAPSATIGLVGSYQFTPKVFFHGDAGWLHLNVNGYTGTVWNVRATVDSIRWVPCKEGSKGSESKDND